MRGLRGRRLGRRLLERRVQAALRVEVALQGARWALGAQVPPLREARPLDRVPSGMPSLVGSLAEGRRERHHGRARSARLDGGSRAAAHAVRAPPRTLGCRERMALAPHSRPHLPDRGRETFGIPRRVRVRSPDLFAADHRTGRRRVVSARRKPRSGCGPTGGGRRVSQFRHARAFIRSRMPRRAARRTRARLRQADGADRGLLERSPSGRKRLANIIRAAQSCAPEQPRATGAGRPRHLPESEGQAERDCPPVRSGQPDPGCGVHFLLADRLALAGEGDGDFADLRLHFPPAGTETRPRRLPPEAFRRSRRRDAAPKDRSARAESILDSRSRYGNRPTRNQAAGRRRHCGVR